MITKSRVLDLGGSEADAGVRASPPPGPVERRGVLESRWLTLALVLAAYVAVDLAYFGSPIAHLGSECACGNGADPETYMWFLAWWPHALLHGHNPFLTTALFAPDHINLGAVTLVPAAAIAAAPVTLLFGPLVSYNVLALAAPVLAAMTAFGLCRHITGRVGPALIGGYIFGFSPYVLGHMMGHLDLLLVFALPAIVHVVLRYLDGEIGRRRCVAMLAALMVVQYLSSPEMTLTGVIVGGLALACAIALDAPRRRSLLDAARVILLAGAIAVVLVGVFIFYALTGDVTTGFFAGFPATGADALGWVIPTDVVRFGRAWFAPVSATFVGGLPENGVYVGAVLALLVARYSITRWSRPTVRALTVLLGIVVVLAMGSRMRIAGQETVPLPWDLLRHLPLLSRAIPLRLGVYAFLIVAILVSMWLAERRPGPAGPMKWALAAIGTALLLPNLGLGSRPGSASRLPSAGGAWTWSSTPTNPRFFTTNAYRRVIDRGETVLMLPWGTSGYSMLWQAETGFWFRSAGAYVGALLPSDYVQDPLRPALTYQAPPPTPSVLRAFLMRRHIGAVVYPSAPATSSLTTPWSAALTAAGLRGVTIAGVRFYRVT